MCIGGFPMPAKAGKFDIVGYSVAAENTALAIELLVVDDVNIKSDDSIGKILTSNLYNKHVLFHRKGIATYGVQLDSQVFLEAIKTRKGISVYTENVKAGTLCVYVR